MSSLFKSLNKNANAKINKVLIYFKKTELYLQNKRKIRCFLLIFSILLMYFSIFLLNNKTFIHGDDYIYSYIFTTFDRIGSFSDILESQKTHYFEWGGRIVVHSIVQALLMFPPIVIDLVNSFAFLSLIVLMYFHAKGRGKHSISLLILIYFFTWLLQPVFGDTVLWITGSVNYLWVSVITLLFLLPFRLYEGKQNNNIFTKVILCLCFFFSGIIAGWTNENTSVGMIVAIFLFILSYQYKGWKKPAWSIAGFIGSIAGYVMLIAAPGNFARARSEGAVLYPFKIVYNFITSTFTLFDYLGVFLLIVAILYILYYKFYSDKRNNTGLLVFIYLAAMLASIYCMIFSPSVFAARSWFGVICYAIIAFGVVFYRLNRKYTFISLIKYSITCVFLCLFLSEYYSAFKDVSQVETARIEQLAAIEDAKAKGLTKVTLKPIAPKTKYGMFDAKYALEYMSHYYGIEISYEQ
ncbi:DUF6056 family protein [Dysgonomonas sp. 520]|uniref:DUF3329 domain-containing protein n=1 Tax=Dysgonomonas sp. 520 TaxID=2302931 RepID=UPI00351A65B4